MGGVRSEGCETRATLGSTARAARSDSTWAHRDRKRGGGVSLGVVSARSPLCEIDARSNLPRERVRGVRCLSSIADDLCGVAHRRTQEFGREHGKQDRNGRSRLPKRRRCQLVILSRGAQTDAPRIEAAFPFATARPLVRSGVQREVVLPRDQTSHLKTFRAANGQSAAFREA